MACLHIVGRRAPLRWRSARAKGGNGRAESNGLRREAPVAITDTRPRAFPGRRPAARCVVCCYHVSAGKGATGLRGLLIPLSCMSVPCGKACCLLLRCLFFAAFRCWRPRCCSLSSCSIGVLAVFGLHVLLRCESRGIWEILYCGYCHTRSTLGFNSVCGILLYFQVFQGYLIGGTPKYCSASSVGSVW